MDKNIKHWKKALKIIPNGNNFYSKNPSRFHPKWPTYFSKSKGCMVWDLNNKKYYDFSYMGVGTNILGYSNKEINNTVIKKIKYGNMTTLNCPEEVTFAEKLLELHPWANMAKFAKTGAEANAIAIRLARAYTKKNKVIICGYHGWHDWYLSAKQMKNNFMNTHLYPNLKIEGVPSFFKGFTYSVKYNDIAALIMEVERDEIPIKKYLKTIRELCNKYKVSLIFDECTTGFREVNGGLHLKYKVNPDIAMFGKAIGNGHSITSVIGKKSIMNYSKKSFISSTFWSERIGFVAGIATLKEMKKMQSWRIIKRRGKLIKKLLRIEAEKNNLTIKFTGLDGLIKFQILNVKKNYVDILISNMLRRGFLSTNAIYVSTSHTEKLINKYINAIAPIFKLIAKKNQ